MWPFWYVDVLNVHRIYRIGLYQRLRFMLSARLCARDKFSYYYNYYYGICCVVYEYYTIVKYTEILQNWKAC